MLLGDFSLPVTPPLVRRDVEFGDARLPERFWNKVTFAPTGCWLWTGAANGSGGYGVVRVAGRDLGAHRVFYDALVGPAPCWQHIDHLCGVRRCVNPAHLEPVTAAENVRRGQGTRLSWEDVRDIRRRHADGERTSDLAREYRVCDSNISQIVKNKTWRES